MRIVMMGIHVQQILVFLRLACLTQYRIVALQMRIVMMDYFATALRYATEVLA
jgi:hypothetical protein